MASKNLLKTFLFCLLACLYAEGRVLVSTTDSNAPIQLKRSDFPSDFIFGASTAAAQIEGSTKVDGRGPSIWDYMTEKYPEKIADGSNMSIATDSYNRWKEDLDLLKQLGVNAYRFSISWTRILPEGSFNGTINTKAIDHYNLIIDTLIQCGIKPVVTIFHFDSPQKLQEAYGGFLSRNMIDAFRDYAEICFREFGDKVKTWITINEPLIIAKVGYDKGIAAPNRCSARNACPNGGNSSTEPYIVSHNMLLAHASAVKLYREKFRVKQGGEIGLSLAINYYEPYSNSSEDKDAQQRALDFEAGWYMDPLVHGEYPSMMRQIVKSRLPTFTEEEKNLVKGSFDFIGINYYTARYVKNIPIDLNAPPVRYTNDRFVNGSVNDSNEVPIGPYAEASNFIYIYPQGLQKLLEYINKNYQSPKIYVTENGVTEKRNDTLPINNSLNDQHRIQFIRDHLYYISEAIKNGVNVKAYIYWSLMDDFEWMDGYNPRFGLYYIDWLNNLKRIPKKSAVWYRDFIRGS